MKSHAVLVSGDISKALNVGAAPIRHMLSLQQLPDHLRSNAPPALIPDEIFRKIGTLPQMITSKCIQVCAISVT